MDKGKRRALDTIIAAHHDALLVFHTPAALEAHLAIVHARIGQAIAGEQLSVALVALTQAVAALGRQFMRDDG